MIREKPEQWLWSYKRWKFRPTQEPGGYPYYSRYSKVLSGLDPNVTQS
nr:hypothetical protein [Oscillatoria laete-virens]